MKRWLWVWVLFGLIVQPSMAHGFIVRAVPENRAVLERPPTRVQYWFSESLEREFSAILVRDQTGAILAEGGVSPDNATLLTVSLPRDLPDGAYIVELRPAFASDGHVNAESRVFFVGQEVGGVIGQAADDQAIPLEALWRTLLIGSVTLLFGVFTLYSAVLLPAWGNPQYRAGQLPPRVMTRLNWIVGIALIIAIGANSLALLQQSMVFFNVSLLTVIEQNLWSVVRIGSRFGDIWNARMLLLIIGAGLFAGSLYWRETQPESVRAFWTAKAWLFALILASFSVISHGAGSLLLPWIAIAVDWLHLVGVGFWIGGLMALVLVLRPALSPYQGETRRVALLAVLKRFSPLAFASAIVVTVSGIYSASLWINRPDDLQTSFGGSLLFKIALIALLLAVAAIHRISLQPERFARWHGRFHLSLPIESAIAIGVLAAAGWLTATPIPVPDFAQAEIPAPQASVNIADYTIVQTILPGGPGVNTYDTVITRDGQPVEGLTVELQKVDPNRDFRGEWQPSEGIETGLYVGAGADIDRAGEWWTLIDIRTTDGQLTRAAFQWTITDEAAVIQTQPPGVQQVILLVILSGVLIWVVLPTARRILQAADLNPVSVSLAVGAIGATIVVLAVSTAFVQESQRQFEAAQNPPPTLVNLNLPDQDSLTRGSVLYRDHCATWTPDQSDFRALALRLSTVRDEELFAYTQNGWRSLPACIGQLADLARWDLVNYLRVMAREVD